MDSLANYGSDDDYEESPEEKRTVSGIGSEGVFEKCDFFVGVAV